MSNNFQEFGRSFQRNLAKLIFFDRAFAEQMAEVLEIGYLEFKFLQCFVEKIFEYKKKYKIHPSYETLKLYLQQEIEEPISKKQTLDFFAELEIENEVADAGFVKDRALDFCKKQKLKEAMLKSVELLQKSSFEEVAKVINDAIKLGSDQNLGFDYLVDFEKRFLERTRNPISTGWKVIDGITKGGLGKGELGTVIASTGCGKTHLLAHLGTQGFKANKNVVHYTLELSAELTASRYDACLTNISLNELTRNKEKILECIKGYTGKILIKEYPTKSASVRTVRSHLERLLARGFLPDIIIIDYADLLKPLSNYKDKRFELESNYEELRAIAKDFNCPVWTASQTNRIGANEEVITMSHISEAYNKCFVADFILTLSRTFDDKQANTGRFFIAKSRLGPDGMVFPIFMNTETVTIMVYEQEKGLLGTLMSRSEREEETAKKRYKLYNGKNR